MILHKVEPTHQRIKSVGDQRLDERPGCSRNVASRGRFYHITNLFALGYHPGEPVPSSNRDREIGSCLVHTRDHSREAWQLSSAPLSLCE